MNLRSPTRLLIFRRTDGTVRVFPPEPISESAVMGGGWGQIQRPLPLPPLAHGRQG
jgi:hypothetical protein